MTWPVIIIAIVIIGTQYYGLLIIAHDGLHRRLFNSIKLNDLWCDVFILGAVGAITRINRINHMNHHIYASTEKDPDRFKYIHSNKNSTIKYIFFLSGLQSLLNAFKNIFLKDTSGVNKIKKAKEEKYKFRDIFILLSWQILLIGALTYFIAWWGYLVLWLLPIYLFAYRGDLLRVFCEHSMLIDDGQADKSMRLISYKSNWLEKLFFSPHNMNYHMAHHLWPSIPYYNLPKADLLIKISEFDKSSLLWRDSYLEYIANYRRYPRTIA